jgi:hypothetical protein
VAIYNRATRTKLVEQEFTPLHPGSLQDGFRFRDISPILLQKVGVAGRCRFLINSMIYICRIFKARLWHLDSAVTICCTMREHH